MPLFDFANTSWGDRSNVTLMKKVQVLQNLAPKIVHDLPKHLSTAEAFDQFGWDNLTKRRRLHRLILFFKALYGLTDWDLL